ncbi:MAG: hypothetical protein IJY40_02385 [Oscillospiraceae bacterium]|nr:hypothetical protein [Oscillospiraceae bacterium]
MNWIQSALMGFVSGISEPMPLSAEAHRGLMSRLMGTGTVPPLFLLSCHLAVLIVMLIWGNLDIQRLRKTAKLLKTPARRRTGHPDLNSAGTLRLLRSAVILALAGRLLSYYMEESAYRLWLVAIPLTLGGFLIWAPTHMRTANKDGRHLSALDGTFLGLGALLAAVPGFSLVGCVTAFGSMLGAQRRYAVRFAWILLCVNLTAAVVMDALALVGSGFSFQLSELLSAGLGALFAGLGARIGIQLILSRIRSNAGDLTGFCYYNWGQALLCLALFLLV